VLIEADGVEVGLQLGGERGGDRDAAPSRSSLRLLREQPAIGFAAGEEVGAGAAVVRIDRWRQGRMRR